MIAGLAAACWALAATALPLAEQPTSVDAAACAAVAAQPSQSPAFAAAVFELAAQARSHKDVAVALWGFRLAAALDPANPQYLDEWAGLELQAGRAPLAEQIWHLGFSVAPQYPPLHWHYGQFLAAHGEPAALAAAAEHLAVAATATDADPAAWCAVAAVAARRDRCAEADGAVAQCRRHLGKKLFRKQEGPLALDRGDCRWRTGDYAAAEAHFAEAKAAGVPLGDRLDQLEAARQQAQVSPLTPTQLAHRADLSALAARVLAGEALAPADQTRLAALVRLAPQPAVGQAALGLLALHAGRKADAELALLRAMAQGLPTSEQRVSVAAALGRLYLLGSEPPRPAEAVAHLSAAVAERPLDTALRWDLVQALRRSGQLKRALTELQKWLRDDASGQADRRREALALQLSLQAALPGEASETVATDAMPHPSQPEGDVQTRTRAARLAGQDRVGEAVAVLREALAANPQQPELQRDLAMYLHGLGDLRGAVAALQASLRGGEDQPEVQAQLGRWLLDLGEKRQALLHLRRAEQLGVDAVVPLAVRLELGTQPPDWAGDLWQRQRLSQLLARLDRMLARAHGRQNDSAEMGEARLLQRELQVRLRQGPRVLAALAALAALLAGLVGWRRWGGADLRQLLERHPDTGPEVQRALASIRHEVLKHNALVLQGLAQAVERGDVASAHAARDHLLGAPPRPGVEDALQGHAAALQQVAAARGVRLNLERRDAAMRPLLRAFAILRRRNRQLQRLDRLGARQKARLQRDLRTVQRLLSVEAYEAVRVLLDAVRLVCVQGEFIQQVHASTCQELGISARQMPLELDQREAALWVRIPRPALHEALTNLLRNAIQATREAGGQRIGCRLSSEQDPITGLETALIAVLDAAPGQLTAQDVQQRPIERGLGLAAEAMGRHDGSLDVQQESAPWTKAVVLRLPRAQPPGQEDA